MKCWPPQDHTGPTSDTSPQTLQQSTSSLLPAFWGREGVLWDQKDDSALHVKLFPSAAFNIFSGNVFRQYCINSYENTIFFLVLPYLVVPAGWNTLWIAPLFSLSQCRLPSAAIFSFNPGCVEIETHLWKFALSGPHPRLKDNWIRVGYGENDLNSSYLRKWVSDCLAPRLCLAEQIFQIPCCQHKIWRSTGFCVPGIFLTSPGAGSKQGS